MGEMAERMTGYRPPGPRWWWSGKNGKTADSRPIKNKKRGNNDIKPL